MRQLATIQVLELLRWKGELFTSSLLNSFACPRNADVEDFLKHNAISFTQKKSSVTHLVFDQETRDCVGYFTIAHKPFSFRAEVLSNTERRRAERFARLDPSLGSYTLSAFLLAQFAKNHALPEDRRADGAELMSVALGKLRAVQNEIGGQAVFLECEDGCPGLLRFYGRCGFKVCSSRTSESDGRRYLQLLTFVK